MVEWTDEMGDFEKLAEGEQINARAKAFRVIDPFPSVPRALLSSAEIRDYIRITGMLDSFKEENLKSASYEVFVGGDFIYWEGKRKIKKNIDRKTTLHVRLPANSITFIEVEPIFRLPDYIAVRFNLRITHVHRGLLLGTGPLVDPGFEGKLLIPVHNLTASEYLLDTNTALIWVEFTKTTAHFSKFGFEEQLLLRNESNPTIEGARGFVSFPREKMNLWPEKYLFKANGGRPIVSSIPEALQTANQDAKSAKDSAETLQNWARGIGVLAVLAALIGITAAVSNAWSIVQSANTAVNAANQSLVDVKTDVKRKAETAAEKAESASKASKEADEKVRVGEGEIRALGAKLDELQRQVDTTKRQPDEVGTLRDEIAELRRTVKALQEKLRR